MFSASGGQLQTKAQTLLKCREREEHSLPQEGKETEEQPGPQEGKETEAHLGL